MTRQWSLGLGVIPYEIAPNFSEAERQRVFDGHGPLGHARRRSPLCREPRKPVSWLITRDELAGPEASPCFSDVGHRLGTDARDSTSARSCPARHRHDLARAGTRARLSTMSISAPTATTTSPSISETCLAMPVTVSTGTHFQSAGTVRLCGRSCITPPTPSRSDRSRPTIIPKPQYHSRGGTDGIGGQLSDTDHNMMSVALLRADERERHPDTDRSRSARDSIAATCCWPWSACTAST